MRKPSLQRMLPLWLTVLKLLKKTPKNLPLLPEDLLNPNLLLFCAGSLQTDSFRWPPPTSPDASSKKKKTRGRLGLMASCATSSPEVMDSFKVYYHGLVSSPHGALCGSEDGTEYNTASSTLFLESECDESPRDFFDSAAETMSADEDAAFPTPTSDGDYGCVNFNKRHRKIKSSAKSQQLDSNNQGKSSGKCRQMLKQTIGAMAELECTTCRRGLDMADEEFRVSPCGELSVDSTIDCRNPIIRHSQKIMSQKWLDHDHGDGDDDEEEEEAMDSNTSFHNLYSRDAVISRHNPIINHIQIIRTSWIEAEEDDNAFDSDEEYIKYPHFSPGYKLSLRCAEEERLGSSEERAPEEDEDEATTWYSDKICNRHSSGGCQSSADEIRLGRKGQFSAIPSTGGRNNNYRSSHMSAFPSKDIMIDKRSDGDGDGDFCASSSSSSSSSEATMEEAKAENRHELESVQIESSMIDVYRRLSLPMLESSEAMAKYSRDPCSDFMASIREMIVAHDLRDSKDLEELLKCYLHLNLSIHHPIIIFAFLSTIINLNIIH